MDRLSRIARRAPSTLWRAPEARLGAALLVVAASVWGFAEIADAVSEGEGRQFDTTILEFFRHGPDHAELVGPSWLLTAAREYTALGGYTIGLTLVVVTLGYLLLDARYRQAVELVLASAGGIAAVTIFKPVFDRARPTIVPHLADVHTLSFPSGHATTSAVIYLTLGILVAKFARRRLLSVYVMAVACLLTVVVGCTRVALGVHYPTDVLAGWILGLAWALICWIVVSLWEHWRDGELLIGRGSDDAETSEADKAEAS